MSVRKTDDTVNRRRKQYIASSGELALEEAMDLSQDARQNEWMSEWINEWIYSSPNMELCDSLSIICSLLHACKRQYLLRWKTDSGDIVETNKYLKTVNFK